jgi:hypothetical protein
VSANGRLIHPDLLEAAMRLLSTAQQAGLDLRALGGTGIVLHIGDVLHPSFQREIHDIDLAAHKGQGRKVSEFLAAQGYTPNRTFNAMHGARRLLFYDEPNRRQVDVFVGSFEMCHQLPLTERLELEPLTLPLAELVMTKLQIVKLNRKDVFDLYSLFLTHEVAPHDDDTINSARIAQLCAQDWGLYRTFQLNLERLRNERAVAELSDEERGTIHRRVRELEQAIEAAPKSVKWKMRARVGDRVRWYEDPEEIDPGGY